MSMDEVIDTEKTEETATHETVSVEPEQLLSILESLLFASEKPVSVSTIKGVFHGTNIDTKAIKKALEQLQEEYADSKRGVTLEEVTSGWQLRTKVENFEFMRRITKTRPFRLSGPALEVLSIIAYKQPLIKNEVDQIRGVESGHLVRALMEKGLVTFEGKTDLPGKPMAYSTTRKFLEIFGLRNIQELPTLTEIDQLLPEGIGDEEEKETLGDVTAGMSQSIGTAYSEGEEELLEITGKLSAIDTSSDFFEEEKKRQKEKRERERAEDIREALAVGEKVEDKDIRWLERYEVQQLSTATVMVEDEVAAKPQMPAEEVAADSESEPDDTPDTSNDV